MKEVIHYLKICEKRTGERVRLEAWCGVEYPKNRDGNSFTHQVTHSNCEECKAEAALHTLAKVP